MALPVTIGVCTPLCQVCIGAVESINSGATDVPRLLRSLECVLPLLPHAPRRPSPSAGWTGVPTPGGTLICTSCGSILSNLDSPCCSVCDREGRSDTGAYEIPRIAEAPFSADTVAWLYAILPDITRCSSSPTVVATIVRFLHEWLSLISTGDDGSPDKCISIPVFCSGALTAYLSPLQSVDSSIME